MKRIRNMNINSYPQLNMGIVKYYFKVIERRMLPFYMEENWVESQDFDSLNKPQVVILSKPATLKQRNISDIINNTIIGFSTHYGTYGMGGPGFFGIDLHNHKQDGKRYSLVYAVWGAGEYTLLDDRLIECYPDYYPQHKPWVSNFGGDESWDDLSETIVGSRIKSVDIQKEHVTLILTDNKKDMKLEFVNNDPRLMPMGSGAARHEAFTEGDISDYLIFQEEGATLYV